jgi:NADH:ubiquinone oxidoreductase subunit B-like Fe-S oxidoreductase
MLMATSTQEYARARTSASPERLKAYDQLPLWCRIPGGCAPTHEALPRATGILQSSIRRLSSSAAED